ncbi:hypothetical protein CXB51_014564 [Gossypium anomalum]|uniref:Integrase catalytic domain-containing protein n=1 Tax=Gossypium anomalum TaxID=47600 RepID=A0A8J5YK33_9ROSI|nr:hypothetical protein CXB51_014564 [Gossypium anomalum]
MVCTSFHLTPPPSFALSASHTVDAQCAAADQSLPRLATVSTFGQWHQRLGHSSLPIINQTDDGGEFRSFDPYHKDFGIAHCLSCPHTSKQNGLVERRHRLIMETGLVPLAQASLPFSFWTDAFYSDVHLVNMLPTKVLNGISLIEKLFGRQLEYHLLRVMLPITEGYKFLDQSGRVYISQHVRFYESVFPFAKSTAPIFTLAPNTVCTMKTLPVVVPLAVDTQVVSVVSLASGFSMSPTNTSFDLLDGLTSSSNVIQQVSVTSNIHPMVTRSKVETYKTKAYIATVSSVTPTDIHEAMAIPSWQVAVHDEIQALVKKNTWDLVSSPPNRSLVGCKWLFKVKTNPDGNVARNKVCLIAQGFSQAPGLDYHETFCSVVKANIVRTVLALAVSCKWKLRQVDVNNAFLNRDLAEDIYMKQPIGFETSQVDPSLFFKHTSSGNMSILPYVDDITITGDNCSKLDEYASELLEQAHMANAKPMNTPMVSSPTLRYLVGSPLPHGTLYLQIVGNLQYLCLTRPDISVALTGFFDVDWTSSLEDRKSTSGFCLYLGDNIIVNPVLHSRVKHVELDMHFVREKVLSRQVQVNYVSGCDQVAEVLTKPLTVGAFTCCQDRMNVLPFDSICREPEEGILK